MAKTRNRPICSRCHTSSRITVAECRESMCPAERPAALSPADQRETPTREQSTDLGWTKNDQRQEPALKGEGTMGAPDIVAEAWSGGVRAGVDAACRVIADVLNGCPVNTERLGDANLARMVERLTAPREFGWNQSAICARCEKPLSAHHYDEDDATPWCEEDTEDAEQFVPCESKQESVTNGADSVGIPEAVGKSGGKSVEAVLTRELERAEKEAAVWHEMEGGHQETNDANYYRFDGIAFGLRLALRVLNGGVV